MSENNALQEARELLASIGISSPNAWLVVAARRAMDQARACVEQLPEGAAMHVVLAALNRQDGWTVCDDEYAVRGLLESGLADLRLAGLRLRRVETVSFAAAEFVNDHLRVVLHVWGLKSYGFDVTKACELLREEVRKVEQGRKRTISHRFFSYGRLGAAVQAA